CQQVYTNPFTF
nr:immunoglobulin light chain junction region [Macaca mulatta]MOV77976.1 immunoglobulin light chain junction region [Macaca mulatta]MOV82860.1 immunoglobulin light chain junction region [Macaca mulatta]MOV85088.1 immunoglobulin light chain junction region [Macaca mulatta]